MLDVDKLFNLVKEESIDELLQFISENNLYIKDGKLFAQSSDVKEADEHWDKLQTSKKLNLNSAYGSLLQAGCKFFDLRLGQSTTLSGRQVVKHMASKVNETITGSYSHVGSAVIYGDTDSTYFTAYPTFKPMIDSGQMEWTRDTVIELYDAISDEVNATFPGFMTHAFHCPTSRGEVIKAGREIVAIKGLFITKKRYAVLYYDKDGKRQDLNGKTGKLKAMGLDLKRSDTPVYMQEFMSDLLLKVLTGTGEEESLRLISEFRTSFKNKSGWEKGSPKRANNITSYRDKDVKGGKVTMPGQVRASLNWNTLRRMNKDTQSLEIVDGMKVIVCKLKLNQMGFTSVAFPVDEPHLPQWFTELPFDHAEMETVIVDNKLDNLLCVLSWDLNSTIETNTFKSLFDF